MEETDISVEDTIKKPFSTILGKVNGSNLVVDSGTIISVVK